MKSFVALLLPLFLFVSFCGYGHFLHKHIFSGRKDYEYLIPGLGISLVIILGGFLNLFHQAGQISSILIISIGLSLAIWGAFRKVRIKTLIDGVRHRHKTFAFQTVALLVVFYFYALGVLNRSFNVHDDFEGYFAFATKLKQLGTLGEEVFSERRLVTSVGGQSFIDSMFLFFIQPEFLHASDLGLGFLTLIISVSLFLKSKGWNSKQISSVAILICLINPMSVNITSTYFLTLLCFLLLVFVADKNVSFTFPYQLTVALLSAAGMTLKNSATPFVVGVIVLYSILAIRNRKIDSVATPNPLPLYLFTVTFWFPWGMELYRSFGTFQYPLLGKGNHGSVYGTFNQNSETLDFDFIKSLLTPIVYAPTSSILLTCVILLLIWNSLSSSMSKMDLRILLYVSALLFLFYVSFTIASDGYSVYRYIFPTLFALFLYLLQFLNRVRVRSIGVMVGFSLMLSISQLTILNSGYSSITSRISLDGLSESNIPNRKIEVEAIQKLLPRDARTLLRTSFNFLFDFTKNDFQIADYPGAASPPPGLPNFGTKLDMETYLKYQKVEFVIFQYKGLFEKENFSDRLAVDYNRWLKAEAMNAFAFHDRMMELSQVRTVLYDDGEIFLLKLGRS